MGDKVEFGSLMATFTALTRRYGILIALVALGLAAFDTLLETLFGTSVQLIGNIASMVASFLLLVHFLRGEELIEREGGFGRYFGASLLSTLGILVGFILLIIPGLFLAARWAAATSLAITRDLSASDALRASWDLTKPSTGILMLLYAGLTVLYVILVMSIAVAGAMVTGGSGIAFSAVTNLVVDVGVILAVALNVAIYIELIGQASAAEAVFA